MTSATPKTSDAHAAIGCKSGVCDYPFSALIFLIFEIVCRCHSWSPWHMLSRATFIPLAASVASISYEHDAGPIVQISLVLLVLRGPLSLRSCSARTSPWPTNIRPSMTTNPNAHTVGWFKGVCRDRGSPYDEPSKSVSQIINEASCHIKMPLSELQVLGMQNIGDDPCTARIDECNKITAPQGLRRR